MTAPVDSPERLTAHFAQIVLPIDFSPLSWHVLTLANRMSRAFGVPRRIVHVDTSSPWLDESVQRLIVKDARAGGPVDVEVVAGRTPADGIMRVLGDEGSLLVMSTHGHTAAAELATGSTAEALLRQWHGPMLLGGPHFRVSPVPFRRLVLCVDPEFTDTSAELTADAIAWATTFDIPVEVLAIVEPAPLADLDRLLAQNQRLERAAASLSTDDRVAKLVRLAGNRPGRDIARYVDSVEGTLVALPTHARPPTTRFVFGSTAMAVLRHVTSPVLVRRFPTR